MTGFVGKFVEKREPVAGIWPKGPAGAQDEDVNG